MQLDIQKQKSNVRTFSRVRESDIEEYDESREFSLISVVLIALLWAAIFIVLYVLISRSMGELYDLISIQHCTNKEVEVITQYSFITNHGDQVYIPFRTFEKNTRLDGKIYCVDKGELQLYAVVTPSNGYIYVYGEQYHAGGELIDGTVEASFSYDSESGQFVNQSHTLFISNYSDYSFTIQDKRATTCLPFSGTLRVK